MDLLRTILGCSGSPILSCRFSTSLDMGRGDIIFSTADESIHYLPPDHPANCECGP